MHEVQMGVEGGGDGVGKGTDRLFPGGDMLKDREVGVEHLVRLADGNGESEPVTSRGHGAGLDAVSFQVRSNSVNRSLGGLNVFLNL